jgi:hypothetical protein
MLMRSLSVAKLFVFKATKFPEAAMLLEEHGWLSCLRQPQHGRDWSYCTFFAKIILRIFDFSLWTLIGTFWLKAMPAKRGSLKAHFERLLSLQFKHLIGAQDVCERATTRFMPK